MTNRITDTGYQSDANGNLTASPGAAFTHDGANRVISNGAAYDGVYYENPTSWNAYAYINGDPVKFSDPTGLGPITLPPVVPGLNCSTAFINYAAQFGETIQDLFNTEQGSSVS